MGSTKSKKLTFGKTVSEHSNEVASQISTKMSDALGENPEFSLSAISSELQMAEQNESLRLIASAYREGLFPEGESESFLIRSKYVEYKIFNVYRAVRVRYKYPPRKPVKIFLVQNHVETELRGVDGVIKALKPHFEQRSLPPSRETWNRFIHASHQSVINEAMAMAYKKVWRRKIEQELLGYKDIFHYFSTHDIDTFDFFTQVAAFEARPITPFTKMKLDLSVGEVLSYSPEFSQKVDIEFIALSKHLAKIHRVKSEGNAENIFKQYFLNIFPDWMTSLRSMGFDPDMFILLPIHPLLRSWINKHFKSLIDSKDIIFIKGITLKSVPTLSFRSMNTANACLKLPTPVQTTHMIRNIPAEEVNQGPKFSKIFEEIIYSEGLEKKLLLETDELGVIIDHEKVGCSEDFATMLNFVLRKNPKNIVLEQDHVVPVAGLLLPAPGDSLPFLFCIMNKRGALEASEQYDYLQAYISEVVGTQLDLFFKTGLMIEAHQQNLNIVFDEEWKLKALMYHDIPGGVSAYIPLLKLRHNFSQELASKLYFFRETPERSVMQFIHPTLTAHLLPLAFHASVHLGLDRGKIIDLISTEIEFQIKNGKAVIPKTPGEGRERKKLIKVFEQLVVRKETLPVKRMLERYYLQAMIDGWGEVVPNPEVLSPRVLVPPSEAQNTLAIKNRTRVIADQMLEEDLFSW